MHRPRRRPRPCRSPSIWSISSEAIRQQSRNRPVAMRKPDQPNPGQSSNKEESCSTFSAAVEQGGPMGHIKYASDVGAPVEVAFTYTDNHLFVPNWMFGVAGFEPTGEI